MWEERSGPVSGVTARSFPSVCRHALNMQLGLHGKTAIVAAASRGLGKAVAQAFAQEGANVVMFARDPASIEPAALEVRNVAIDGAQILGLSADVTRRDDLERVVKATVDRFDGADIVLNNAGGPKPGVSMNSLMMI